MTKAGTRTAASRRTIVKPGRRTTLCKNGLHHMTAENTYQHPGKGAMCRDCIRDYMRDYMRERRASQAVASKRGGKKKRRV